MPHTIVQCRCVTQVALSAVDGSRYDRPATTEATGSPAMSDKYLSFSELAKSETQNIDYRVDAIDRSSETAIFAPHGGHIEPGTSEIARAIAGDGLSLYCFEGLRSGRAHGDLHITSTQFDEPVGCALASRTKVVVAIHGRQDRKDEHSVWLGGLDQRLRNEIEIELRLAGFETKSEGHDLPARHPDNICNRGSSEAGVQLEMPLTLRDALRKSPARLRKFSDAVRKAIDQVNPDTGAAEPR